MSSDKVYSNNVPGGPHKPSMLVTYEGERQHVGAKRTITLSGIEYLWLREMVSHAANSRFESGNGLAERAKEFLEVMP